MATVLEKCTTEEQRSVVRFLWVNELNAKDIHKEMFPVYGEKCLLRKAVHNCVANVSLMMKWMRQQSTDFCVVGIDAFVKRWDKFINVGGKCVEK
jgi:hypothetical protein